MKYPNYYTGVGSRNTPDDILLEMRLIAKRMSEKLFIVRSGGAQGADTAFQAGAGPDTEIYLPWNGFNNLNDRDGTHLCAKTLYNYQKAMYIASMHHEAWEYLKDSHKALHARNVYQVLGHNLDNPSQVLICYAEPDGITKVKGGTNTAVSIAHQYNVPVYNLFFQKDLNDIKRIIGV